MSDESTGILLPEASAAALTEADRSEKAFWDTLEAKPDAFKVEVSRITPEKPHGEVVCTVPGTIFDVQVINDQYGEGEWRARLRAHRGRGYLPGCIRFSTAGLRPRASAPAGNNVDEPRAAAPVEAGALASLVSQAVRDELARLRPQAAPEAASGGARVDEVIRIAQVLKPEAPRDGTDSFVKLLGALTPLLAPLLSRKDSLTETIDALERLQTRAASGGGPAAEQPINWGELASALPKVIESFKSMQPDKPASPAARQLPPLPLRTDTASPARTVEPQKALHPPSEAPAASGECEPIDCVSMLADFVRDGALRGAPSARTVGLFALTVVGSGDAKSALVARGIDAASLDDDEAVFLKAKDLVEEQAKRGLTDADCARLDEFAGEVTDAIRDQIAQAEKDEK